MEYSCIVITVITVLVTIFIWCDSSKKEGLRLLTTDGSGNFSFSNDTDIVPRGNIIMWSGAKNAVPQGWGLCDGRTYQWAGRTTITPDLRGRFIRMFSDHLNTDMARMGQNNNYRSKLGNSPSDHEINMVRLSMGHFGGTDHMVLHEGEMPIHSHAFPRDSPYEQTATTHDPRDGKTIMRNRNTNEGTGHEGAGWGHNNVPPFYVLAFIMKL